jgi:hypothetical protein
VIDPTYDEIDFIRMLAARQGKISLGGSIKLLKINRLIPEYVTLVSASMQTGVFTLTEKGWQLAQMIDQKFSPVSSKMTNSGLAFVAASIVIGIGFAGGGAYPLVAGGAMLVLLTIGFLFRVW